MSKPLLHTVSVYRDNGRVVRFNDMAGVWTPDADVRDRLVKDGSDWLYIMASGDKEWFDSSGKLLRIRYVDGGLITVTYPDTTAVNIADAYGNDIDLTLDIIGRVTAMVDPDNQAYRYAYTIDDNLEYVSYPDTTPGAAGSNPFGEDNPVSSATTTGTAATSTCQALLMRTARCTKRSPTMRRAARH